MQEIAEHLREPYRVYAIHLDPGMNKRPTQAVLFVHIGRPVSLKVVCESFIFKHLELIVQKTGELIQTSTIVGIQKVPNGNKPQYELRPDGTLVEIQ